MCVRKVVLEIESDEDGKGRYRPLDGRDGRPDAISFAEFAQNLCVRALANACMGVRTCGSMYSFVFV